MSCEFCSGSHHSCLLLSCLLSFSGYSELCRSPLEGTFVRIAVKMSTSAGTPPLPKYLIGFSTKIYFTHAHTQSYIESVASSFPSPLHDLALFIIPTFPSLAPAAAALARAPHILLGAQDCHYEDTGAWTGEVSPAELKEIGCSLVELGHAERRRAPFGETDEITAKKARAATRNGLIPLVCIGERSQSQVVSEGVGLALKEVLPQIHVVLDAVEDENDVIFAYEPVWAIGASKPAGADHVCAVIKECRRAVKERGRKGEVRFLYGGSAGPGTWEGLKPELEGLFLGRFAHSLDNLKAVVKEMLGEAA